MISDQERNKALNTVIIAQCFGQVASLCFINGLMFNYLTSLDIKEESMVIYLRLPSIIGLLTTLPLAYLSDSRGKSKLGQIGNFIQVLGLFCLCSAAWVTGQTGLMVVGGIILFSLGCSLFNSSWFALLDPIIKPEQRGPFFAKMRTVWKLFGVTFTFVAQFMLEVKGDEVLTTLLLAVALMSLIRMFFYAKIPELEVKEKVEGADKTSFLKELKMIFGFRDFLVSCLFILWLPMCFGCLTIIYNFYEKLVLKYESPDIVLMGNMAMIGGVCGFSVGAFALKRLGEKKLFTLCSLAVSCCLILYPLHFLFPWIPIRVYTGGITLCTGLSMSAMSIGLTSMMLHLLPQHNKSLGTSLFLTAQEIGNGLAAGILSLVIALYGDYFEVYSGFNLNVYSAFMIAIAVLFPLGVFFFNKKLNL